MDQQMASFVAFNLKQHAPQVVGEHHSWNSSLHFKASSLNDHQPAPWMHTLEDEKNITNSLELDPLESVQKNVERLFLSFHIVLMLSCSQLQSSLP